MSHYDKDARQILRELRESKSEAEYIDVMWAQRYPKTFERSSNGWPFRRVCDEPAKSIRVVK